MTDAQQLLYDGMGMLFDTFGEGGAVWRRTRATGAAPETGPTIAHTSGIAIRFLANGRIVEGASLPHMPIFDAKYWGLCPIGTDVQAGDIFDNGQVAFLITGVPDVSQGFMVPPCDQVALPG